MVKGGSFGLNRTLTLLSSFRFSDTISLLIIIIRKELLLIRKRMFEQLERLHVLIRRLKERGHRMTPQRVAVLKILASSTEHLTADQIHQRVLQEFPMTSLATVYKTVNLLKEMGELLELSFGSDSSRFDGSRPHPHPHLICTSCQQILDPDIHGMNELPEQIARMYGYQIVGHRLDIFGICPECQEKESRSKPIPNSK
jgi:Fur family transcriptional regulator, peroxide stress response regulator